jgi:hypothetical protein
MIYMTCDSGISLGRRLSVRSVGMDGFCWTMKKSDTRDLTSCVIGVMATHAFVYEW